MALETVVYPKLDPLSYGCNKDFYSMGGGAWGYDFCLQEEEDHKTLLGILDTHTEQAVHSNWDSSSPPPSALQTVKDRDPKSSPEACSVVDQSLPGALSLPADPMKPAPATTRRKRRRTRTSKNKEEIENQRMTHIVVERNRRKQMNEYLAVLRSLMPPSYVQRGDQASIIGGAINFVKELEHMLQSIEGGGGGHNKKTKHQDKGLPSPLAEFFTFPQYSTRATSHSSSSSSNNNVDVVVGSQEKESMAVADIEVTMVDSHANLKILSKKHPRQLLKMVAGFQALRLTILHLNVTTVDQMVLHTVSVKIEEGCHLNTADEIAAAVNQMLHKIQEEPTFS